MNRILHGTLAIGLLFAAAACSSDDDSSDTTVAAAVTAASTVTSDATGDTGATETTAADSGTVAPSADGLNDLQAQVYAQTVAEAATLGITFDEACFKEQLAKISDADAQAILDAGPAGDPVLSDEALAITEEIQKCPITEDTPAG